MSNLKIAHGHETIGGRRAAFVLAATGVVLLQFLAGSSHPPAASAASAMKLGSNHRLIPGAAVTAATTFTAVRPAVSNLADGSVRTAYVLPAGASMTTTTPPAGFSPLTATDAELQEYNFPARPTDPASLQDWTTAMSYVRSDAAPTGDLPVATNATPASKLAINYSNWAGYEAGKANVQSHTYVAVKGYLTVPSTSYCATDDETASFWIGLGGTAESLSPNNLVQQGIGCGNSAVGTGSSYRPWTEFADTANPLAFCGYKTWTIAAGHVVYQNMSYQASSKTAYFYLEDETSGVTHSCSSKPPAGWSYDANTAEWIAEAPSQYLASFGSMRFTDAQTELDSNSTWVTLGSQPQIRDYAGVDSTNYCMSSGAIGSDKESFTISWHSTTCY